MAPQPIKSYGAHFAATSVARNYLHRPPYSPEVFDTLIELLPPAPRSVVDAGCGPGKLARGLLPFVERIDAVDPSRDMLELARRLSGGDDPKVRWICARIEEAPLAPPYGLAMAGASFHWMETDTALDLFADALCDQGLLVLLDGDSPFEPPWREAELGMYSDYIFRLQGQTPDFPATDLARLERPFLEHARFVKRGAKITRPHPIRQSVEDYVSCQHSRATWAPDFMGMAMAAEFDARLRDVLSPHADSDGMLSYVVRTRMEWGKPLSRRESSPA